MKLSRRLMLWIAISTIVLPGVVAIALMPSSVEGVYNPFSSFGCDCDQFMEFRDGKVVTYVMGEKETFLTAFFEKDASGATVVRLGSDKSGKEGKPIMRAESHLLGTRFYYLGEGKSEWFWKRFVTRKMKDHMTSAEIRDVVFESEGNRTTTYDYQFNVIGTSFRPKRATSPLPASPP
ncbi:MAG: hypothetical protein V4819_10865 [Verrucomicrobiota bacterium]